MSRFVTVNRVMTAFITETDLHVSFISFRLAGIQEHGGIFVQCVASSWQHGKAKANMFEKMLKRTKKKSARSFLWTRWGSEKVCQPPVEETKPKQSRRVSVHVNCVCVHVNCVCAGKCWLGKCGVSSRAHKAMKACDDRVWWTHSITDVGTHARPRAHTHTLARAHKDAFTLTNAIKAVTADGDT